MILIKSVFCLTFPFFLFYFQIPALKLLQDPGFIWQRLGTEREIERAVCKTVKNTEQPKCESYSPSLYTIDGYNKIFFIHPSKKFELFTHIYMQNAQCDLA